jgi:hypothetical protein
MRDEFNREQRLTELALARIEDFEQREQQTHETAVDAAAADGVDVS